MLYVILGACLSSASRSVGGGGSSLQDWRWEMAGWMAEGKKACLLLEGGRDGLYKWCLCFP